MSATTVLLAAAWAVVAGTVVRAAVDRRVRRRAGDEPRPAGVAASGRPEVPTPSTAGADGDPADVETAARVGGARAPARSSGAPSSGAGATNAAAARQVRARSDARPASGTRHRAFLARTTPVEALGAVVRRHTPGAALTSPRIDGPLRPHPAGLGHDRARADGRRDPAASDAAPTGHEGGGHPERATDVASDRMADRRAGWSVLAGLGLLAVAPALAAVPLVWSVALPVVTARRRQAADAATLADQLPDVVDLLALTARAGLPVAASLRAIGDRPGGPLGSAMARAAAHVDRGGTTAGALAIVGAAGPGARPLVDALAQHDRYGSPLLPALDRVAVEARARRRRRAEEAARRLPVTLLLPLVLTTFPAFVLLTIVPLLAGSLGSLSLSPT